MRRLLAFVALFALMCGSPAAATACPMCKVANDKGSSANSAEAIAAENRATAYTYSIFFMMSMPPLVLAGLTVAIRREIRKAGDQVGTLT